MNSYKIIGGLGGGSFGQVFKVQTSDDSTKEYAMKKIYHVVNHMRLVEVDLMSRIDHPNVIKAKDVFLDIKQNDCETTLNIIMPLAQTDLFEYVLSETYKKTVDETVKTRFCYEILSGLICIHKAGAYHCDVKPENVLIINDHPVLTDLGLAEYKETSSISMFSSPVWSSPESLMRNFIVPQNLELHIIRNYEFFDQPFDPIATEIWSLGLTFVFILTQDSPISNEDFDFLIISLINFIDNPILALQKIGVPEKWIPLLTQMLEPKVEKRLKNLESVLKFEPFIEAGYIKEIQGNIETKPRAIKRTSENLNEKLRFFRQLALKSSVLAETYFLGLDLFILLLSSFEEDNLGEVTETNKEIDEFNVEQLALCSLYVAADLTNDDLPNRRLLRKNGLTNNKLFKLINYLLIKTQGKLFLPNLFTYAFSEEALNKAIVATLDYEEYIDLNFERFMNELQKRESVEERENRKSKFNIKFNTKI